MNFAKPNLKSQICLVSYVSINQHDTWSNTLISCNREKVNSSTDITTKHGYILTHKVHKLELFIITTSNSQWLLHVVLLFNTQYSPILHDIAAHGGDVGTLIITMIVASKWGHIVTKRKGYEEYLPHHKSKLCTYNFYNLYLANQALLQHIGAWCFLLTEHKSLYPYETPSNTYLSISSRPLYQQLSNYYQEQFHIL